jgi:hypothetical protein
VTVLREALGALAQRGQFSSRGLRKARPEQLTATVPHQVFVLGLDSVAAEGEALERAQPAGWRYLLEVDKQVVASAETRLQEGERHSFSHVNDGPFVRGTVEALAVADSLRDETASETELRLLHVPGLYLMGLWLRPSGTADAERSRFIPIAPTPPGFEAGRVYSGEEFLARVRELAQAVPRLSLGDSKGA